MTALLNKFSEHVLEVLSDLLKKRLQDQGCALSFQSVRLIVPRSGFIVREYTPFANDCVKEEDFIRDRLELRIQAQLVLACGKFDQARDCEVVFCGLPVMGRTDLGHWWQKYICCFV